MLAMASKHGLYVYALMGKPPAHLDMLGIDKQHKVYPVTGRELYAIVSNIDIAAFQSQVKDSFSALTHITDSTHNETEQILQAHENVVDTLMHDTPVVPFKFGTVLKDEEAALKMLQDDEAKFKALLAKFTDKAEWGLKIFSDQQAFIHHSAQAEPDFKNCEPQQTQLSRGTAYLLSRKMDAELKANSATRLAEVAESIFHTLGLDASEAKLNQTLPQKLTGHKQEMILNAVYLLGKEHVASFCQRGKELMEQYAPMGLDLVVSGPWPPYSFTF